MHDAHCHIDLYPFYRKELAAIAGAGLRTIAVTNAPSVFDAMVVLAKDIPQVFPAIGLHPELVAERERELPLLLERLTTVRFVGEVGLDFSDPTRDRTRQVRVLEQILGECARRPGKILSLHSRRAESEVVRLVGPKFPGTPILHWYSGPPKIVDQALSSGFYFSVNSAMIRSERGQALISSLPEERILTESDGPFVQVGGVPATPADVKLVLSYLAAKWRKSVKEVEVTVDSNFDRILAASQSTTETSW